MIDSATFAYDLFISHAAADRAWVTGYLLPALGLPTARTITKQDFHPGTAVVSEFERAVTQSRYTVVVLSPAYLTDEWSTFGEQLVSHLTVTEQRERLIPVLKAPCELPLRVAFRVRLDCTDEDNWAHELARLRDWLGQAEPPWKRIPCPYPGMVPFSAKDARFFYGRDTEIQQALQHLRHQRYLFVIGPSGSGKSSLVRAGLLPQLAQSGYFPEGFWLVREMRPGNRPLQTLTEVLSADPAQPSLALANLLAGNPPAQRLLLVIDQLEELFAQHDRAEQHRFVAALQAVRGMESCALVITMRADFYPDLMNSDLWPVDSRQRLEIAPLRGEALRQAIQQPAADIGVYMEAALVERLLADAADEPGVLPLLQETMVLLWEKMERRLLPLRAYERLGSEGRSGLSVAVATKADATVADLSEAQQKIARRMFLRLVQFGEGRANTRRQQPISVLRSAQDDRLLFDQTLNHLADHRLLTLSGEETAADTKVDISHEALIDGWPTLHKWLTEQREAEQIRRRLAAQTDGWIRLGRGSGGLFDEVELREAEQWLASPTAADLGYDTELPALVQASRAAIEKAKREQEEARQRELAQARALTREQQRVAEEQRRRAEEQTQAAKRLRLWVRLSTGAGLVAATLAIVAFVLLGSSNAERDRANAERDRADRLSRMDLGRQLPAQAVVHLEADPQRSLLLAVEAVSSTLKVDRIRIGAAEEALHRALVVTSNIPFKGHAGFIDAITFSPDGRWLATSGSLDRDGRSHGVVQLWDVGNPDGEPIIIDKAYSKAIAFSPDNRQLAVASSYGLMIKDVSNPTSKGIFLPRRAIVDPQATPTPWHTPIPSGPLWGPVWGPGSVSWVAPPLLSDGITAIAYDPRGHWVATGDYGETVLLWSVRRPLREPIILKRGRTDIDVLTLLRFGVQAIAFSPNGRWLVVGSRASGVQIWDVTNLDADPIILIRSKGKAAETHVSIVFSPDERWLAIGSRDADGTVELWNVDNYAAEPLVLQLGSSVSDLTFSIDGHQLTTWSSDGKVRRWNLANPTPTPVVLRSLGSVTPLTRIGYSALSRDGHWLATIGSDERVRLWDLTLPIVDPVVLYKHDSATGTMAFSPDGYWLAVVSGDTAIWLWDRTNHLAQPVVLREHKGTITRIALSADGQWLATGSLDKTVRLWSMTNLTGEPVTLEHKTAVTAVAFSPKGHRLVTSSEDRTLRVWDVNALAAEPITLPEPNPRFGSATTAMAFSYDGRWLITTQATSSGRQRYLWDMTDLEAKPVFLGYGGAAAFSPDGRLATVMNQGTLRLETIPNSSDKPVELHAQKAGIKLIAFSSDGHWLATGGAGKAVQLWDMADLKAPPVTLLSLEGDVTGLVFSPDSQWLATAGGQDKTIRLWSMSIDKLLQTACGTVSRNLASSEWEQFMGERPYWKTCPALPGPTGENAPRSS